MNFFFINVSKCATLLLCSIKHLPLLLIYSLLRCVFSLGIHEGKEDRGEFLLGGMAVGGPTAFKDLP